MTAPFSTEPREARIWIRGIFRLDSGQTITRTIRRDFTLHPGDDERPALVDHELVEEVTTAGWDFPEGHGTLVEILGTMQDV
jgi:hypothetical protein